MPGFHKIAWPSGLRRWFKAPVSSGAWVRIPPLSKSFSTESNTIEYSMSKCNSLKKIQTLHLNVFLPLPGFLTQLKFVLVRDCMKHAVNH